MPVTVLTLRSPAQKITIDGKRWIGWRVNGEHFITVFGIHVEGKQEMLSLPISRLVEIRSRGVATEDPK